MKVIYICLEQPYIDNWGYHENILPKYTKNLGCESVVIGSRDIFPNFLKNKYEYLNKTVPYEIDGVKIIRLKSKVNILNRLVIHSNLLKTIENENPDIIYLHGAQSLSLLTLVKYKKRKGCKLIVDFHSDYGNSGKGKLSRNILHKLIWKSVIKHSEKNIDKLYCISPWVKEFVKDTYNIKEHNIEMTYLGADDDKINFNDKELIRKNIRAKLNIGIKDKVIISGGKINKDKNIDKLINAVDNINDENIKLIIFGSIEKEYADEIEPLLNSSDKTSYVGWINAEEIYNYYLASDIAVFPGTQSALWQQAIYCGLPLIVKKWPMSDYLNDGNVLFLESDNVDEIENKINYIIHDENKMNEMSKISIRAGQEKFSYTMIAKKILE